MRRDPRSPASDRLPTRSIEAPTRSRVRWLLAFSVAMVAFVLPSEALAKLSILGETALNGIFDPTIEVDPESGEAWLAYSAVYGSDLPWGPNVETHMARSVDGGLTWTFEAAVNVSEPGEVMIDGLPVAGFWNKEVASLAYDALDPGAEWKMMNHYIFRSSATASGPGQTIPTFSWLELHEAPTPTGPWQRVQRMGSGPWPPAGYPIDFALNDLDPLLSSKLVYSEPGLFAYAGDLYLSLTGIAWTPGTGSVNDVILLSSSDHGVTWEFVGPLLAATDAAALGFTSFGGTAIVEDDGRVFLLASPGTETVERAGVAIFQFTDLTTGTLVSDASGIPRLLAQVPLTPTPGGVEFGGQAEYHALAAADGILQNQLETVLWPEVFQIDETNFTPAPEPDYALLVWIGTVGLGLAARRRLRSDPFARSFRE